jgi:hypothetical protein
MNRREITMNLAVSNTRTLKLVKQHSIAAFCGICIIFAAAAGGVIAVSQTGSGTPAAVAPRADYSWARPSVDWRTTYYLVPTHELGDQILRAEAEQQNAIIESRGQLSTHTVRVIVVDTPEQEQLVSSMMAEASAETTSFVDLRYPPIPAINSPESAPLSQAAPLLDAGILPAQNEPVELHQPYTCTQPFNDAYMVELLAGLCN